MARLTTVSVPGACICLLLWLVAASVPAYAQTDAYSVEVAVSDKSLDEQQNAYAAALRRVLINNSGDKTLLNRDQVRVGLRRAEDFVVSFSYRTPPAGTVISADMPITEQVRQTGQATQLMEVSFDRSLVRELITTSAPGQTKDKKDEAVPVVRSNSALVWMLIQDADRDIIISDPAAANVQSRSREIAGAGGVSLIFPTAKANEAAGVDLEAYIDPQFESIQAASVRYEQDTVLIGVLARNGVRGWVGQWTRLRGDDREVSTFESTNLDDALHRGLSVLSGSTAIDESYRYGGETSDTEALIWVGSLNSLSDYAKTVKFFEGLPGVSTVYPKEVMQTSMVFAVLPRSAMTNIEAALAGHSWLSRSVLPVASQSRTPAGSQRNFSQDQPGSASDSLLRNADMALELNR